MRACTKCGKRKPASAFKRRNGGDGVRKQCRDCYAAGRRARYLADPEHERHHSWRAQGIDVAQAKALFSGHKGGCDLCGADKPRGMGDWHVDHDHSTGRLRGLLCFPCNVLLGKIERIGLCKIHDYIRRHGGTVTKKEASPPPNHQEKHK